MLSLRGGGGQRRKTKQEKKQNRKGNFLNTAPAQLKRFFEEFWNSGILTVLLIQLFGIHVLRNAVVLVFFIRTRLPVAQTH